MLKSVSTTVVLAALALGFSLPAAADELEDAIDELAESQIVFEEIVTDPETRIPPVLLQRSEAIIIITNLGQGGFIVGGRSGDGLMVVREANGAWSNPAFLTLGGGSIGLQFGGRSSDIIMLVQDTATVADIINGGAEFGAGLSGTAGPVSGSAFDPDEVSDNDILVYSRSSGLFGGITFDGSTFSFDEDRNEMFYNEVNVTPDRILLDSSLTPAVSTAALERALLEAQ